MDSQASVYRRIVSLWYLPQYRIVNVLSELQPILSSFRPLKLLKPSTLRTILGADLRGTSNVARAVKRDFSLIFDDDDSDLEAVVEEGNDGAVARTVAYLVGQTINNTKELAGFTVTFSQEETSNMYLCRLQMNNLVRDLAKCVLKGELKCKDHPLNLKAIIRKRRLQDRLLRQYCRLIGSMTRLSMIDCSSQLAIDDAQLMKLPYKCSRVDKHERAPRKQHHHDGRRRKERHRQRRRLQRREKRLAGRQQANEFSEEDVSDRGEKHREEATQRRNRWREMEQEEKRAGQARSAQHTPPEDVEARTDVVSPMVTDYVDPGSKRVPETHQRVNAKTKAKISINLNLGGAMAALNKGEGGCQSADDTAYSLSDGIPYPAIEDQRDIEVVHRALMSRKRDIELKLNDVVYQLNIQAETQPDDVGEMKLHERADVLRAQIRRMDTQLDYVQTRIEVENAKCLTRRKSQKEKEESRRQVTSLVNRMARLHHTMKEANRQHQRGLGRDQVEEPGPRQQEAPAAEQRGLSAIHSKITDLLQQKGRRTGQTGGDKRRNRKAGQASAQASLQERQKQQERLMSMLKADGELSSQVCRQIDSFVQDGDADPVLRALGAEAKKRLGANKGVTFEEQRSSGREEREQPGTAAADVDEREFAEPALGEPFPEPAKSEPFPEPTIREPFPEPAIREPFAAPPMLRGLISSGVPSIAPPPIVFNVPPPSHLPPPSFGLAHLRQFLGNAGSAPSSQGYPANEAVGSVDEDSTDSEGHVEDVQEGFPFARQTEIASRPSFGCGLFVKDRSGAETDVSAAGTGTCWALNEICRLLAKQRNKYCVFGGPQVRRIGSLNGETGSTASNFNGIASFYTLNSLLYTDQD